ncbi:MULTISPECIES: hypothetical protein [Micromonospora]|uniref:hypothetical protein n=2 Tax=Micromonosporaceae TaxID=28056 RepID=UPI00064BFD24|nr:hypothetical protein [Micromonospora sp. WMMD718]MDG4756208.1 hypothetical protein [Micromonospora sp. WMMD718]
MVNDLIAESLSAIASVNSPDDGKFQSALLLSYAVCMEAADRDEHRSDSWTFAGLALRESYDRLTRELPDDLVTSCGPALRAVEPDEARAATVDLIAALARVASTAVASETFSPWRRLVWSSAATHLDKALRELR